MREAAANNIIPQDFFDETNHSVEECKDSHTDELNEPNDIVE